MAIEQANIAKKVLEPEPILRPDDLQVEYFTMDNCLIIDFKSIDDRVLRVGISSIIDSLKTILEAMDELSWLKYHIFY